MKSLLPLEEVKQGGGGHLGMSSLSSSGSVFVYTLSRSSGLKDTPYAQHQRRTGGMAESMKDDEYMVMKRMNVDS